MLARAAAWAALFLVLAGVGIASADPSDVYNDFIRNGKISCTHPRKDLNAVLQDAVLNQYGDPLVIPRLKREVRLALSKGCYTGPKVQKSSDSTITSPAVIGIVAVVVAAVGGFFARRRLLRR